MTIDFDL